MYNNISHTSRLYLYGLNGAGDSLVEDAAAAAAAAAFAAARRDDRYWAGAFVGRVTVSGTLSSSSAAAAAAWSPLDAAPLLVLLLLPSAECILSQRLKNSIIVLVCLMCASTEASDCS